MVNLQDTPSAGQISAADLEAARQHSTGRIVHLRRTVATVRGGFALVALLAVAGYAARAIWPMAGA